MKIYKKCWFFFQNNTAFAREQRIEGWDSGQMEKTRKYFRWHFSLSAKRYENVCVCGQNEIGQRIITCELMVLGAKCSRPQPKMRVSMEKFAYHFPHSMTSIWSPFFRTFSECESDTQHQQNTYICRSSPKILCKFATFHSNAVHVILRQTQQNLINYAMNQLFRPFHSHSLSPSFAFSSLL